MRAETSITPDIEPSGWQKSAKPACRGIRGLLKYHAYFAGLP